MTADDSDPGKQISVSTVWIQHSLEISRGGLPCHLSTLMSQKKKKVASVFAVFSCFKEGLVISTPFYMLELKPEVSFVTIFET